MKTPRDYQIAAVASVFNFFATHRSDITKNPIVAMPTGTGKSAVIAGVTIRMLRDTNPHHRFLVLTHSSELVKQNSAEILEFWPGASVGIHSAELGQRDTHQAIIVGTIASVANTLKKNSNAFGLRSTAIIDEAHMIPQREESMYQKAFSVLRESNPNLRFLGFTATPFRSKVGVLTEGGLFSDFAINLSSRDSFNRFINEGYLAPLVAQPTVAKIDVSNVKLTGGEFNAKQLEEASNVERISHAAVGEMLQKGFDRNHWLIFCSSIKHIESVATICESYQIETDYVHSKRSSTDNERAKSRFASGKVRCLVSGDMITTGYNVPQVDLIGMLRATNSVNLHVQMAGRGTRTYPGKQNCLYLDFAGNCFRLGPINEPRPPRKPGEKKGTAPVKICANCSTFNATSARICHFCLAEFPEVRTKLKETAYDVAPLVGLDPPTVMEWPVRAVHYKAQVLKTGKFALRVSYTYLNSEASKLIFIESSDWMGREAKNWWKLHCRGTPLEGGSFPATAADAAALASQLRTPAFVQVSKRSSDKWWKVEGERFTDGK